MLQIILVHKVDVLDLIITAVVGELLIDVYPDCALEQLQRAFEGDQTVASSILQVESEDHFVVSLGIIALLQTLPYFRYCISMVRVSFARLSFLKKKTLLFCRVNSMPTDIILRKREPLTQ